MFYMPYSHLLLDTNRARISLAPNLISTFQSLEHCVRLPIKPGFFCNRKCCVLRCFLSPYSFCLISKMVELMDGNICSYALIDVVCGQYKLETVIIKKVVLQKKSSYHHWKVGRKFRKIYSTTTNRINIIWQAPQAGSMRRIVCSDRLPERARWNDTARPGLLVSFPQIIFRQSSSGWTKVFFRRNYFLQR